MALLTIGIFDLSYLRMIPNLMIMTPKDSQEAFGHAGAGSAARGVCGYSLSPGARVHDEILRRLGVTQRQPIEVGKAEVLSVGSDITIIAVGTMVAVALEAASSLSLAGGL